MGKIFIVLPDAPVEETAQLKPSRKLSGGIRLGVLDNSKANADHLLQLIIDGVKKQVQSRFRRDQAQTGVEPARDRGDAGRTRE